MEAQDKDPGRSRHFGPPRVEILRLDFSRLRRSRIGVASCDGDEGTMRRLRAIVRGHLASAERIGAPLEKEGLLAVVEALRREGGAASLPRGGDAVAGYLCRILHEDLAEAMGGGDPLRWHACLSSLAEWVWEG